MLTILCVGRLGEHKGQLWLLSVWLKARSMFHRATRLVLIGRDEGAQEAIQSMIRTVGLEQEVTLTGEVSDAQLAAWYRRSSLLVLFSRYEAFGLVFFEAMVCGVPVLTHEVGANRELLRRGASIVPRFDEPSAVEELVRLVNDDNYRMRLGREARDYALSGFTWSRVAEKYLRIYEASD